jgi:hypothetical protein
MLTGVMPSPSPVLVLLWSVWDIGGLRQTGWKTGQADKQGDHTAPDGDTEIFIEAQTKKVDRGG